MSDNFLAGDRLNPDTLIMQCLPSSHSSGTDREISTLEFHERKCPRSWLNVREITNARTKTDKRKHSDRDEGKDTVWEENLWCGTLPESGIFLL